MYITLTSIMILIILGLFLQLYLKICLSDFVLDSDIVITLLHNRIILDRGIRITVISKSHLYFRLSVLLSHQWHKRKRRHYLTNLNFKLV